MKAMSSQRVSMTTVVLSLLLITTFVYSLGRTLNAEKPGLDWYDPDFKTSYKVETVTLIRMTECTSLIVLMYYMLKFPEELKVIEEYRAITVVNLVMGWLFDMRRQLIIKQPNRRLADCYFFDIKTEYLLDIIRTCLFCGILAYYSKLKWTNKATPQELYSVSGFMNDDQGA